MFVALLLLLGQTPDTTAAAAPPAAEQPYLHVLAISIDGLRSDALTALPPGTLPAFARLQEGAFTLNARPDPVASVTLPNHADMLTGRPMAGREGHGWSGNLDPEPEEQLRLQDGSTPQGLFSVLSDHRVQSHLFASKSKFVLFKQTWPEAIRDFHIEANAAKLMDLSLAALAQDASEATPSLCFLHLRELDDAGHAHGWILNQDAPYMDALRTVDHELSRLFAWLDRHPDVRRRTAIVLTSDHGGGIPLHNHAGQGRQWVNLIIPFFIWTGDGKAHGDLYELNAGQRRDPSLQRRAPIEGAEAPIRNGELANLCLQLLGLPPVPASLLNARQDLRWSSAP